MKRIPQHIAQYFWDADISAADLNKRSEYIISRLLNFGDEKAIRWIHGKYSYDEIVSALRNAVDLHQKAARYWSLFYGVNPQEVRCLSLDFQAPQRAIWPY